MSEPTTSENKRPSPIKTLLACAIVLLLGAGITVAIFLTEPTAQRSAASRETAMLVNVVEVQRGTYHPTIVAMGTVKPAREITFSPRVSGEIVERSASFTPGGFVEKGETLLHIDPSDYENVLRQRRSELSQANADLTIEMGHQEVARRDYQFLGDGASVENEALVLRKPQLDAVQARVEAADAAVAQAELDLERTRIKAPFDARVLTRNANEGSQVSPGENLGRLVGLEEYWVAASVPLSKIHWLSFANGAAEEGAEVRVRNRTAWPDGEFRIGYLDKLVGTLESGTRMAEVLISIPDPLGHESDSPQTRPLIIGAFLEAQIEGREMRDVVRLNRDYVRQGNTVWVMKEDRLEIREVEIPFRDAEYAYVADGLEHGDYVVTTNLATVVEGSPLRLETSDAASAESQADSNNEEEPAEDQDDAGGAPAR